MIASFNPSGWRRTRPSEYAVRFLFGGAASLLAMILAKRFGPAVGGLFLALPAIFPASATLVEKHEAKKKRAAGVLKTVRGRQSAALDAAGASIGAIGLAAFATIVWRMLPLYRTVAVLAIATFAWLMLAITIWVIWKWHGRKRRRSKSRRD